MMVSFPLSLHYFTGMCMLGNVFTSSFATQSYGVPRGGIHQTDATHL